MNCQTKDILNTNISPIYISIYQTFLFLMASRINVHCLFYGGRLVRDNDDGILYTDSCSRGKSVWVRCDLKKRRKPRGESTLYQTGILFSMQQTIHRECRKTFQGIHSWLDRRFRLLKMWYGKYWWAYSALRK